MVKNTQSNIAPVTGKLIWRQRVDVIWKIYFSLFFIIIAVLAVVLWRTASKVVDDEFGMVLLFVGLEMVVVYLEYIMLFEIIRRPVTVYAQGIDVANAPSVKFKFFVISGLLKIFQLRQHFFSWTDIEYLDKMQHAENPYQISVGVVYILKTVLDGSYTLRFSDEDEDGFHGALKSINASQNIFTVQPPKFLKTDMTGIEYRIKVKHGKF